MPENSALRAAAREQLRGTWLVSVGLVLIFSLLIGLSSALFGVGLIIVGGPLTFGFYGYFLHKARREPADIENLFDGFKVFGSSFLLFLLQSVFLFLWSLLFVIPGIVKSFSYAMSYFILRDNPGMSALDAITASRKMMDGYKAKLFCLYLSFIGWWLLCLLTFGIGYLWLLPYCSLSLANFYENLKHEQSSLQITA